MVKKQTKAQPSKRAVLHHHVKMAVVPHKANDHRPHLVRRYGLALVLAIVLASQGIYNSVVSGNVLGIQAELSSKALLSETNQARADNGLHALTLSDELNNAAQLKLEDMFKQQYWAHVAPDGTTPWHWFEQAGYQYAEAGENLAKNFSTSGGVVSAWMVSPTHRANVLKDTYRDVGFAIKTGELNGRQTTVVVAMYGMSDQQLAQQGVAGTNAPAVGVSLSPMVQFGLVLKNLNPVTIASVVLLLVVANIAFIAHLYRKKLPLALRQSWYRHHGAYKAVFLVLVATLIVAIYGGGGQI